jgi:3-oxoacyl-[acyl-carrier protein] reductase
MQQLKSKVAVVTGAGKGIGRAIAVAYGREGANVVCAARTESDIRATVSRIEAEGGHALAVPADVTKLGSVESLFESAVGMFGGVDVLVANAGGSDAHGLLEDVEPSRWLATVELNLIGTYYCVKIVLPIMKRQGGGKIIVVGSGIGHRGLPGTSAYACAKAGVWMLVRVLAQEVWRYNISVNELIPGPVVTEGTRKAHAPARDSVFQTESEWVKQPEDVAPLAVFLATQPDVGPTAQSFSLMRRDG